MATQISCFTYLSDRETEYWQGLDAEVLSTSWLLGTTRDASNPDTSFCAHFVCVSYLTTERALAPERIFILTERQTCV
eukprot:4200339-Amphidinium_carterae.1